MITKGNMDINKLVVGQYIYMRSGPLVRKGKSYSGYGDWVKVIEVMPTGVIAQWATPGSLALLRFDKDGILCAHCDVPHETIQGFDGQGYPVLDTELIRPYVDKCRGLPCDDDINELIGAKYGPFKLYSDWLSDE